MKSFIKITLLLLALFSLSAEAYQWKLRDMDFKYTYSVFDQFIYIPDGEYFTHNKLEGQIYGSAYHSHVEIYLDDKLITVFALRHKDSFKVSLPSMKSGFHKLTFIGLPDTLVLSIKNREETYCPKMRELPFGLEHVSMYFDSKIVDLPKLNKYQEVLFNPTFPSTIPLTCSLVFDEVTPTTLSAAARMISAIKVPIRNIHYIKGENNETDFSFVFKKLENIDTTSFEDTNITSSIFLERTKKVRDCSRNNSKYTKVPTRLTFSYRDDENLYDSVNAMLNHDYLKVIEAPRLDINTTVNEPKWGILQNYKTLRELGVSDTTLIGDGTTSVILYYPIYWEPTDRLHGKLLIRAQSQLPQDTHLNIWLDTVLSGSVSVAYLQKDDIERTFPVDGLYIPKKNLVRLDFDAVLNTRKICEDPIPGKLWISADKSWIEMPHRQKSGIISVIPALVAKPTITLSTVSSGTLSAMAVFVKEEQTVTLNKPLAYDVHQQENDTQSTLHIEHNLKRMQEFFQEHAPALNRVLFARSVWLHSPKDGKLSVIAANDRALEEFDTVWNNIKNKITDGATDVVVDTQSQEVVVINQKRDMKQTNKIKLSDNEYKYGMLAAGVIFMLVVLWLLYTMYRKD